MDILIKGIDMLATGLYLVSVDNTGDRDKTVATIEHMLDNSDMRHIVGSFELVSVPSHGRVIDVDAMEKTMNDTVFGDIRNYPYDDVTWRTVFDWLDHQPDIIEAEE